MKKELINGGTSFKLVEVIAQMLENEKVSNDWKMVSKYYSLQAPAGEGAPIKKRYKYIYLAYDSESTVEENKAHMEMEHFDRVWTPDIILVFGEVARQYYKKKGFETYLLPLGYDDLNYEKVNIERDWDVGFIGSMDKIRWSNFYLRSFIADVLFNFKILKDRQLTGCFTSTCPYDKVNEFFSRCLVGFNDLVRPSPNMRCYEIPSNGSVMLVNSMIKTRFQIQKPKDLFIESFPYPLKENKHYMIYANLKELLSKLKWLIENKEETIKMGEKARKIILKYPLSDSVKKFVDKYGLR